MKNNLEILQKSPLFNQIAAIELTAMLTCLGAQTKIFSKHNFIFTNETKVTMLGVVLTGCVHVIKEDFFGNRTIISHITAGDIFAETFSCAQVDKLPVSVIASEKSEIMLIDYKKIISTCSAACRFHTRLIQNMLKIIANKNILLTQKIEHMSKRNTREKLLSYLSAQAQSASNKSFTIPLNRQELADYLSVDRSAMSTELGKMRDEGLVDFNRNYFKLKL